MSGATVSNCGGGPCKDGTVWRLGFFVSKASPCSHKFVFFGAMADSAVRTQWNDILTAAATSQAAFETEAYDALDSAGQAVWDNWTTSDHTAHYEWALGAYNQGWLF